MEDILKKAQYEIDIFERPSLKISLALIDEVKSLRAALAKAMPIPKQEPAGAVPDNGLEIAAKYIDGIGDHLEKKWKEYTETSTGGCATTFHTLYHELANEIRALSPSPRITEQDARKIIYSFSDTCSQGDFRNWHESKGRALLNKLNANSVAEVRKEPVGADREMLITLMSAFDTEHSICESCGHQEETMYMDSANMLRDYLQSNPAPAQAAAIPECDCEKLQARIRHLERLLMGL